MKPSSSENSPFFVVNKGGFDAARHLRKDDLLNRWPLAREIFRIATEGPREWSVRIGVYGEWGSGKTSVLRFIESMAQNENHIVFPFNPWQFQSGDDLWKAFVKGVFSQIEHAVGKNTSRAIVRQGKRFASQAASALPGFIRLWNKEVADVAEKGLGLVRKYLTFSESDLKELAEILGEKRLIITIDDLDRTDAGLVPEMLFALKEIMDVPGMSFVCAFDPVVVGSALGEAHHGFGDGLKFLEKIIDYPRWLPEPSEQQLAALALSDADTFCPYVPKSDLAEAMALLPPNPRAVRKFIRILGLLHPQIERHYPQEIHWSVLLTANALKVQFPKLSHILLSDTKFWQEIYKSTLVGPDRDNTRRKTITSKIDEIFPRSDPNFNSAAQMVLEKCINAISARLNAWHGLNPEALFYQFRLAESPHAVTWKEFDIFAGQINFDSEDANVAARWITEHSECVGQSSDQVYSELLTAAIERRSENLRAAADAMSGKLMNFELDRAASMLGLIEKLIFQIQRTPDSHYSIEPSHLSLLFSQIGQYFAWRRTPKYRAARARERKLLTRVFNLSPNAMEPWIDVIGTRQWEGREDDHGPEWKKLIAKFRQELRKRCSLWVIQQISTREEFVRHVIGHEKNGHRFRELLFDRSGPIWVNYRQRLLKDIRPNASSTVLQNNAYELLTWLEYKRDSQDPEHKAAEAILSDAEFASRLWGACVAAPLNPRAVGSLRGVYDYLKSKGTTISTPEWWQDIMNELPKPSDRDRQPTADSHP